MMGVVCVCVCVCVRARAPACRGGKEMPDDGQLAEFAQGKAVTDSLTLYLVVRFPGASFALPSEEDSQGELPVTVGEESMMRSSRIVLRGTVTIPVPERDMQRVVHRILNRGSGSGTPSLEDLVSSMSYLPRYRRMEQESETPPRRAPAAGPLSHRRRRRRRMARSSALAVDLRAHSVSHVPGPVGSSAYALCSSAAGDTSLQSWSRYLDLELQQPHFSSGLDESLEAGAHEDGGHDSMFDQHLALDASHQSMDSNASFRRVTELDDVDQVQVCEDADGSAREAGAPWRYTSASSYGSYSYQRPYRLDPYDVSEESELARSQSTSRATQVAAGSAQYECRDWRAFSQQLPPGRMAGKRKHADMSGQALLEQRLTARCRNLSLEDEEDVDKDARPHAPNAGVECLDALAPALLGEASSAGAASAASAAAAAGDAGVQRLSSSVGASGLNSAFSDEIERWEARSGHEDADTRQGYEEPATPLLSDSHQALASASSARSAAGQPAAALASHGVSLGRTGSARAALPNDAASRNDRRTGAAPQQHQLAADADEPAVNVGRSRGYEDEDGVDQAKSGAGSVQAGTSAASNHVPSVERRQENERAAARVLQDKEGGIHMSCDPLASVPLEELAMSSGSMRPVSAALRTALTMNASAPHAETPDAKGKERRADVPAGSDASVHLPWSGGGSSSVRPANVPGRPPACFSTSAATALEVVSCVLD